MFNNKCNFLFITAERFINVKKYPKDKNYNPRYKTEHIFSIQSLSDDRDPTFKVFIEVN